MRRFVLACALASTTALQGCFFVFIPGSLIAKASDAMTGDKGEHCIARGAKVGDRIRLPGNGGATVLSVSGESVRCSNPAMPIRAELQLDT